MLTKSNDTFFTTQMHASLPCFSVSVLILPELRCLVVSVGLPVMSRSKLGRICYSDIANGKTGSPALRSLINPGGTSLKDVSQGARLPISSSAAPSPWSCDALVTGTQGMGSLRPCLINALPIEPPTTQLSQGTSQVPGYLIVIGCLTPPPITSMDSL